MTKDGVLPFFKHGLIKSCKDNNTFSNYFDFLYDNKKLRLLMKLSKTILPLYLSMNQGSEEPIFHTTCDLLFEYTFAQTIDHNVRANIPLKWDTSLNHRQPVFHSQ